MKNDLVERLRGYAHNALETVRICTEAPSFANTALTQRAADYTAAADAIEALSTTPGREEIAEVLAGHFGLRAWSDMAGNRGSLRMLYREDPDTGWDLNEPTRDDCLAAADDILSLLRKEGVQ